MAASNEAARRAPVERHAGEAPSRKLFGVPIGLAAAIIVFAATIVAMVIAVAILRAPGS